VKKKLHGQLMVSFGHFVPNDVIIRLGQWANEENAIPSGANKYAETSLPDMNIDIEDIEKMIAQQDQDFFNN
jgi:hypothetical protein